MRTPVVWPGAGSRGGAIRGILPPGRPALAAVLAVLSMASSMSAATWTGVDFTWSQPDADSFDVPFGPGDAVVFGGAGSGTVAVAAGGVSPGSIAIKDGTHTFMVKGDDALGKAPVTTDYAKSASFVHALGREVTLANSFFQPNGANLTFAGGNFRLTGTVHGGANFGPKLTPAAGTTLTLDHGVSGSGDFSITSDATGATIRILGASSARLSAIQSRGVRIEIGADNALGPAGAEASISITPPTFVAYGGPRSIASGIYSRGFAVTGEHDLTIAGPIRNSEGYYVDKSGPAALVLAAANPDWGNVVRIREGVVRLGHTNALGTSAVHFSGGVLELAASDFSRGLSRASGAGSSTVGWVADGASGAGGGFSARGGHRRVNIGGQTAKLTWGTDGFVATGQSLVFGSKSADFPIEVLNPIELGGSGVQEMQPAVQTVVFGSKSPGSLLDLPPPARRGGPARTIRVDDNPASDVDRAELSGVLSGAADIGLDKTGDGTLYFTAANTYTGDTTVRAGSVGGSGRIAGNLFFSPGSGFVFDAGASGGPFLVAGAVDLGDAAILNVLGAPRTDTRLAVLRGLAGIRGRFGRVTGLPAGWMLDYSVAGEVAIVPQRRGL